VSRSSPHPGPLPGRGEGERDRWTSEEGQAFPKMFSTRCETRRRGESEVLCVARSAFDVQFLIIPVMAYSRILRLGTSSLSRQAEERELSIQGLINSMLLPPLCQLRTKSPPALKSNPVGQLPTDPRAEEALGFMKFAGEIPTTEYRPYFFSSRGIGRNHQKSLRRDRVASWDLKWTASVSSHSDNPPRTVPVGTIR